MADEKKWYEGFSFDRYKGYKLFQWRGDTFLGAGVMGKDEKGAPKFVRLQHMTNRFVIGHSKKDTTFQPEAVVAFNTKVELYAQSLFRELVEEGNPVTREMVFSGNKLSDEEIAERKVAADKKAKERAAEKAERDKKNAKALEEAAKRRAERAKKLEERAKADLERAQQLKATKKQ